MAYIRKFKTTSGATGVQVCFKERGKVVKTIHIGSGDSPAVVEKLEKEARKVIEKEQGTKPLFNLSRFEE